jgi:hypothetical protein
MLRLLWTQIVQPARERRQVLAQSALLNCVSGAHNFRQSAMLSDGSLQLLGGTVDTACSGLGTRPLPKAEGSCGLDLAVPVPFCSDGIVVVVLGS